MKKGRDPLGSDQYDLANFISPISIANYTLFIQEETVLEG